MGSVQKTGADTGRVNRLNLVHSSTAKDMVACEFERTQEDLSKPAKPTTEDEKHCGGTGRHRADQLRRRQSHQAHQRQRHTDDDVHVKPQCDKHHKTKGVIAM